MIKNLVIYARKQMLIRQVYCNMCTSADKKTTETQTKTESENKTNEFDNQSDEYEDYGDAKVKKGGRNIKVEAAQVDIGTTRKAFKASAILFRLAFWGSLGCFIYTYYVYKTDPNYKNRVDVLPPFLDAVTYVDKTYNDVYDFFTKPPLKKMLPDLPEMPMGFDPPKTLVINLSDTVIHSDFVFGKGREVLKRPGLVKFLRHLSQFYEIVVFSDDDIMFVTNICEKLDPSHQIIAARLGSESHVIEKTSKIKDLKYLNRDLRRILVIETNPDRLKYHLDNGIFIKTFDGNPEDNTLNELLPLLEHLGRPEIRDVREELKKYGSVDPAKQFLEEIRKKREALANKRGALEGVLKGKSGGGWFSRTRRDN